MIFGQVTGQNGAQCAYPYLGIRFFGHFWANRNVFFLGTIIYWLVNGKEKSKITSLFSDFDFLGRSWRLNGLGRHAGPKGSGASDPQKIWSAGCMTYVLGQLLSRKHLLKYSGLNCIPLRIKKVIKFHQSISYCLTYPNRRTLSDKGLCLKTWQRISFFRAESEYPLEVQYILLEREVLVPWTAGRLYYGSWYKQKESLSNSE